MGNSLNIFVSLFSVNTTWSMPKFSRCRTYSSSGSHRSGTDARSAELKWFAVDFWRDFLIVSFMESFNRAGGFNEYFVGWKAWGSFLNSAGMGWGWEGFYNVQVLIALRANRGNGKRQDGQFLMVTRKPKLSSTSSKKFMYPFENN